MIDKYEGRGIAEVCDICWDETVIKNKIFFCVQ